jgi:hypothetical protein
MRISATPSTPAEVLARKWAWVAALALAVWASSLTARQAGEGADTRDTLRLALSLGLGFLAVFAGIASLWSP